MADEPAGTVQHFQADEAMDRFSNLAKGASIVEGGKGKPGLVSSALSALVRFARGVTIGVGIGLASTATISGIAIGINAMQTAYNSAVHAIAPRGEGVYGGIVARMQSEVDSIVGPGKIVIYDRSAPKEWEDKRVAAHLGVRTKFVSSLKDLEGGGAYAGMTTNDEICVIMGASPVEPAVKRFDRLQESRVQLGDVTDEVAILDTFAHEVGHCLIAKKDGERTERLSTEGHADAFAALMVMRDTDSKDYLPLLLASRELDEYTVNGDDAHFTSMSLRWVLEKSKDPVFVARVKGASIGELVEIAKEAPSLDAAPKRIAGIRDAVADLGDRGVHYVVPVEEGFVMTSKWEWLRANSGVPEFRRMVELSDYLTSFPGSRTVPGAFSPDPAASAAAIADIAARGDPKAAAVAAAFGSKSPERGAKVVPPIHKAQDVAGTLVPFDRDSSTVSFDRSGRYFVVKDSGTGKAQYSGIVGEGITRKFGPHQDMDFLYDPSPVASMR